MRHEGDRRRWWGWVGVAALAALLGGASPGLGHPTEDAVAGAQGPVREEQPVHKVQEAQEEAHQTLERVLREAEVSQTPAKVSSAGYLAEVARRLAAWLVRGADKMLPESLTLAQLPRIFSQVLGLTIVVFLIAWAVGWWRKRRRPPKRKPDEETSRAAEGPSPRPDLAAWARALEERLTAGPARRAAEALWWWTARALLGDRVEESWTAGDLLRASGRRDLAPSLRGLDACLYGRRSPRLEEVRDLATTLRKGVSGGGGSA